MQIELRPLATDPAFNTIDQFRLSVFFPINPNYGLYCSIMGSQGWGGGDIIWWKSAAGSGGYTNGEGKGQRQYAGLKQQIYVAWEENCWRDRLNMLTRFKYNIHVQN